MARKGTTTATRAKKKTRKKTRKKSVKFVATPEQRSQVSAMSSAAFSAAVMQTFIINPDTKKAIGRRVFFREFKAELEASGQTISAAAMCRVVDCIHNGSGRDSLLAAMYWLNNRERELFSTLKHHRAEDRKPLENIARITPKRTREIAENVLKVLEAREKLAGKVSIHDKALGNA